ncbi:MAG: DUF1697 domain-containing protein [Acidobacteria bacterium]|nr:DUF1697 domain-containing protein [Acidobacteriota bacterium]
MKMVALLRGVNVGRGKRVAMADLRQLAESFGWRDVSTILATGNVIFSAPRMSPAKARTTLVTGLRVELGLQTRVGVLTAAEVSTLIDEQPFGDTVTNPSRLLGAAYLDSRARAALEPLAHRNWSPGALALGTHAAYVWCPDGILASPLVEAAAKAARDGLTSRNWATWAKISQKLLLRHRD